MIFATEPKTFVLNAHMNNPIFKHDCPKCKFLGNYFNLDVYICESDPNNKLFTSIIARHGDKGEEYASNMLCVFKNLLVNNQNINVHNQTIMPFRDYLFSPHVIDFHKAWLVALTIHNI